MKVFISWSGDQSKKYAEAIRDWLPGVLQLVTPYFTPTDIEKGSRWSTDIAKELDSSQVGIICITRDNIHADWVLFEAGALSKSLDKSHVCPVIFGISNTDLSGPLKQFQATEFEKSDFQKLISLINNKLGDQKLPPRILESVFDKWWPDLKAKVDSISDSVVESTEPLRTERELIEEILTLARSNAWSGNRPPISPRAIQELLEAIIHIHEDQAFENGSYQDVLDMLEQARRPLTHISFKYRGFSSDLDSLIERFTELDYKTAANRGRADSPGVDLDDDIPF